MIKEEKEEADSSWEDCSKEMRNEWWKLHLARKERNQAKKTAKKKVLEEEVVSTHRLSYPVRATWFALGQQVSKLSTTGTPHRCIFII